MSLVAGDRQWFKARIGFDPCETDLSRSVCAHALVEPDILEIEDLTQDPRSMDNPLVVGAPHIRFYAGAPMRTADGHVIGSLCVIDTAPRPGGLSPLQRDGLRALARQVITQLELRKAVAERDNLLISQKEAEERRHGLLHLSDSLRDAKSVAAMTRAAATIVGQTIGAERAAFARFDAGGEHLAVERDWTAEGVASIEGTLRLADYGKDIQSGLLRGELLVVTDVLDDPMTADHAGAMGKFGIRSLVNVPIRENGRTVAVLIVHDGKPRSWPEQELTFLRNVADRVEVGVARLEADSQQRLLNGELSHRMKNTMALVQAIASQTLRSVPDQGPVKAFSERLLAMSVAHDILLQDSWKAAKIGLIINAVACTFSDAERFDIQGPPVTLGSRATLAISLLIHELTTNALKYGALSNDAGRVRVEWDVQAHRSELCLKWIETGGPSVLPPTRRGFGSKLIRLGLIGTGGAEVHYPPHGFEAVFTAPLADLQKLASKEMSGTTPDRIVVLIVEDEPLLRIDAVDMIEDAGYEAVQAGNSAQALKALESRDDIRIIMSDIHMPPGMDGIDFVTLALQRWPHVHVVLVSGNVEKTDARLPQGGIFFSKPYRQTDLVRALGRQAA